jgi:hypothetical protein
VSALLALMLLHFSLTVIVDRRHSSSHRQEGRVL